MSKYPLYKITVKNYMLKKSNDNFDFMRNFNKDIPMPFKTMCAFILKETNKMYYMRCRGEIFNNLSQTCNCCGRPITNDISKYFGVGPICGHHNYTNPFNTKEELREAILSYKENVLHKIIWEGWIPKSAITQFELFEN